MTTSHGCVALAVLFAMSFGSRATAQKPPTGTAAGASVPAPAQKFYKNWTMDDLLPSVMDLGTGHDWRRDASCSRRPRAASVTRSGPNRKGRGSRPTSPPVGSRYTRDFILQSILEPSATLNGQFFHTTFTLKNGDVVTGSVIDIVDKKILVAPVMLSPQATVEIAEADVKSEAPSPVSPMPAGLAERVHEGADRRADGVPRLGRRSQRAGLQEEMNRGPMRRRCEVGAR